MIKRLKAARDAHIARGRQGFTIEELRLMLWLAFVSALSSAVIAVGFLVMIARGL